MKTKTLSRVTGVLALCLALNTGGLIAEDMSKDMKGHDPMMMQLKEESGTELEKSYLQMMMEHHNDGIKMAQLAAQNSQRAEVKELAGKIVAAQQTEIQQMKGWLESWYKASPDPNVVPETAKKMMQEHMGMLEKAQGDEFDKAFLNIMSTHHTSAVSMSEFIQGKTERTELKELANKIKADQSKEIQQMQSWRQQWFQDKG